MTSVTKKLLPVRVNDKCGYITAQGEIALPCDYHSTGRFHEGLATICTRFDYDHFENHEIMVINDNLDEVGRLICEYWGMYSESLLAIEQGGKYGYVDASLKAVISPQFRNAHKFVDGLAWASVNKKIRENGEKIDEREGFIDRSGNWVISAQYMRLWDFKKGERVTACTRDNANWGLLDRQGRIVAEPRFRSLGWPNQGMLAAGMRVANEFKVGIINEAGDWLVEPRWDATDGGFAEDLMSVELDDNWGLVNRAGEWVIPPRYTNARQFSCGLCGVYVGGGRDSNYGGLQYGKYGFINKAGEMVIEPRFDDVSEFVDGICKVEMIDGNPEDNITRYGYIDTQGRYIWEPTR